MAPVFDEFIEELDPDTDVIEVDIGTPDGRQQALDLGFRSVPSFAAFYDRGVILKHTGMASISLLREKLITPLDYK